MLSEYLQLALNQPWQVSADDLEFLKKFDVPAKFHRSPLYRHLHRSMFLPSLKLYQAKSALSGTRLLSMYPPERKYKILSVDEWWGNTWQAINYGRPYNFTRSFFSQFSELFQDVPKYNIFLESSENCDYSLSTGHSKNCYYCNRVYRSQDCYYCEMCNSGCDHLCDCLWVSKSSWLYDCSICNSCNDSISLFQCENCYDCYYCIDCAGCSYCLFCCNLRHASYCFNNRQVSKEEFFRLKAQYIDGRLSTRKSCLEIFGEVWDHTVWSCSSLNNCEDCLGDVLYNCAHCHECYYSLRLNNSRYCSDVYPSGSASYGFDLTGGGSAELVFNSVSVGRACYLLRMCLKCRDCSNLTYCTDCFNCESCFGCSGLVHKQYCVLNKQYHKDEYRELTQRIIAQMTQSGDWGLFFPLSMAPFPFNHSFGPSYVDLSREEALSYNFPWRDPPKREQNTEAAVARIPESISDFTDDMRQQALCCARSGRLFRISKPELELYRKMSLPPPQLSPDERSKDRRKRLRPRHMWPRNCRKTGESMYSTFLPGSSEVVYSTKAYLNYLYE